MDWASTGVLGAIAAAEPISKKASRPDSTVSALTVTDIPRRHSSVMAPFPAAPLATGHLTRRSNCGEPSVGWVLVAFCEGEFCFLLTVATGGAGRFSTPCTLA